MKEFMIEHPYITWGIVGTIVNGVVRTATVITGHPEPGDVGDSIKELLEEKFNELIDVLKQDPEIAKTIDDLKESVDELNNTTVETE